MIDIPEKAQYIIDKIIENDEEAYIVGGCVRDSILDRKPLDWDITTSASPQKIKSIFERTIDTGIQHGTVTVMLGKEAFEVTTYRIDLDYIDYRRPSEVVFTNNLIEDLKRRDFTMNAIAYNHISGFIDPFLGIEDIKNKLIRCVGNPDDRFNEDALRMMRCIRFSAQLGFDIKEDTFSSIQKNSELITNVSSERIRIELIKTIISQNVERFLLYHESGLMKYILPEWESCIGVSQNHRYHIYDVDEHIIKTVESIENIDYLRLAMLFHDIAKPLCKTTDEYGIDHFHRHAYKGFEISKDILKRLKFDNKNIDRISKLVLYHDIKIKLDRVSVKYFIANVSEDIFLDLLKVKKADACGQNPEYYQKSCKYIDDLYSIYKDIKRDNDCISKKDLDINGKDILGLDIKQGKMIGEVLEYIFRYVIKNPNKNNKYILLEEAKKYIEKNV